MKTIDQNNNATQSYLTLYIKFDDYLTQLLGFEKNQDQPGAYPAKARIDLFGQTHTIYVYSNILKATFIGNTKARLLRTVAMNSPPGKNKPIGGLERVSFNPLIFVPLNTKTFDNIDISLHDDVGELVSFESGKVVATLLFRPLSKESVL